MKFLSLIFAAFLLTSPAAYAIETAAEQAIVYDDATGNVLFAKNADVKMHPSSMSKLMTIYIAFQHLKDGSLKLTDELPVSEKAWRTQGSKTFVELGAKIPVEALLQGIIIQSGNDACVVIAESLAGSEEGFANQMNEMATKLGLTNSHFTNATGMPDDQHLMSAHDLAILSHHIIHDFPEYYHYFAQKEFVHHGIKQGNRNLLLYKNTGVDGLKTGHTEAGGYGIAVSGKDATDRRLIVVVNGLKGEKERAEEAERLLAYGFRDFEQVTLFKKGEVVENAEVWYGVKSNVALVAADDVLVTLPKGSRGKLAFKLRYDGPVPAPIKQGDSLGSLIIESPDMPAQTVPLVASESVEKLGAFARMTRTLRYYVLGK